MHFLNKPYELFPEKFNEIMFFFERKLKKEVFIEFKKIIEEITYEEIM
jgi:hypothetical protein